MLNKITLFAVIVMLSLGACVTPRVYAQTFGVAHAAKLVFDGNGGSDFSHTITISLPALSGSSTLTLPGSNAAGILTNDGSGVLSWASLGTSSITPGANYTFLVTNGSGTVAWTGFNKDATFTGNGVATALGLNLANPNTWTTTQTFAPTADVVGVVVQGTSAGSPSSDIFDVQSSGGSSTYLNVDNNGLTTVGNGLTINGNFDAKGKWAVEEDSVTINGGTVNNDVSSGSRSRLAIGLTGTAATATITGFTGGSDGSLLNIMNLSGQTIVFANENAGSAQGHRIRTRTGGNIALPTQQTVTFTWDKDFSEWVLQGVGGVSQVSTGGTGLTTITQNGILYGNGTSPIQATSAAANSVLVTDGSNVPSLSQTLPAAVQANISSLTGITGVITYPTGITFNGAAPDGTKVNATLSRNTGSVAGLELVIQAGAPALAATSNNLWGGNLVLSSGISEGTGESDIFFRTPTVGSIGNGDNLPVTRLSLNSTQLNLATGVELDQNGTQRISSSGAGTLLSLTLGTPLAGANGGTGSPYVSFTTGGSTARTYTLPDANSTLLSSATGVQLQSSTPGTAQNGNVNIAGVLLADSIGIGTSSPKGGLDVSGTLIFGVDSVTIVGSSTNNDVSPGSKVDLVIGMSGTAGAATITGFSGGVQGRFIKIANLTGQNVTLANLSNSSSAGNQIYTATGQDLILPPNSLAALTYTTEGSGWNVEYTGGMPVAISLGGTGASSASGALANLLPSSPTTGYFLEWNGSAFVWNSVSAAPGVVTSVGIDPGSTGLTVSNSPITSSGDIGLAGTLAISHGGTGQTTQPAALKSLTPDSTGNSGKVLAVQAGGGYVWTAVGTGNGTVTSVSGSGGTTGLTLTGGPITSTGTLTLGGTLAVANGGTGQASSLTQGGVVYGASTTAMATSAAGTSGQVLISGGTGAPSFTSSVSGLTITNSTIGSSNPSTGAFTSVTTPTVYGGSAAGSTLNLQSTSNGSPSGDYITFSTGGTERARITNSGMLGLGITPSSTLDINGKISIEDDTTTIVGGTVNNNVSSGNTSRLSVGRSGSAAAATITGFTGGTTGSLLTLINLTGQNLTLANSNSGSTLGNRILTQTGGDVTISSGQSIDFTYDQDFGAWVLDGVGGLGPVGTGGTGVTSFTQNGILFGNGSNPIQVTSAAANSVLVTNGSNVPSLSQTLPSAVQGNITSLTGMTGAITYPTALTFDGTSDRTMSMARNTGTNPGQGLTIQAGAPALTNATPNLAGGNLTLSSGISEGTGTSSIIFQTSAAGSSGNGDNTPATRLTLDASNLNLGSGLGLEMNGTSRVSSAGAGTLASLTLSSALTVANGGTGLATIPAHSVLIGEGTSNVAVATPTTAGWVLTSNGGSSDPTWQASAGAISSVSNSDGTLTISPTTGNVVASLALGHANAWSAQQTFSNSTTAAAAATFSNTSTPSSGTVLGTTISSTGISTGTAGNVALQLTASGSTGTAGNTALSITAGKVNITDLSSSSPVFTDANKNLISNATVPVVNGGTGTSTAFTPGSVVFAGSGGTYSQDNANFFWDATTKALVIGGAGSELPNSTVSASGNLNNYLQINNQNLSSGDNASSDFVATADNGSNSNYYVDFGINGSGYNQASYDIGKADDGYVLAQGGNLDVGTSASGDSLVFFTGGNTVSNRAMSIDGSQIVTLSQYGAGALSTSSSGVVSAGTLSVANGGTGQVTFTNGQLLIGNTTGNTLTKATLSAGTGISITNGTGSITITNTGFASPLTTSGDMMYENSTPAATRLAGNGTATKNFLSMTSSVPSWGVIAAGDIPTLNQNTTGTAANVTGTVGVSNGGTGQTTYTNGQLLIGNTTGNTLTKATLTAGTGISITNGTGSITIANTGFTSPMTTSGDIMYENSTPAATRLAGNGTATKNFLTMTSSVPSWGTIAAGDIPTLNQNTTGTAANVTGTVATANGGTGQTTYTNGQLLIGNTTGNTLTKATLTAGTGISITNSTGSITITNSSPATGAWSLSGNASIAAGSYLGTTDANDLVFETVGSAAMTIGGATNVGDVGIGTTPTANTLAVGGNIEMTNSTNNKITTANTDLVLEQTGDTYGTTRLHIQNRNGSNSALFEQAGSVNLCDFGFKPGSGAQSNLRLEGRSGTIRNTANNAVGEFEFFMGTTTTPVYNFSTGEGATSIELGNVGIGLVNPTQKLQVKDGNLLLSNSATADQLQFQGTSTGISTFQAGAQGATNFNYTLPTTIPTANQALAATLVSAPAVTLGWITPLVSPMTTSGDIIYENSTPAATRLAGNSTATKNFLTMTSSVPSWGVIAAGDIPTLNQNTTGTANVSGGTAGAIPYQSSANTTTVLAATATAGQIIRSGASAAPTWSTATYPATGGTAGNYLRSDGTNFLSSAIQAGDVPTLNQSTTGTASNVTGTVAVPNGGTGQTTYTNGQLLIGNTTGNTLTPATLTAGTGISVTNGNGSITIANTGLTNPMTTSGDIIYENSTPAIARLAGNSTATKNFLTMTSSIPSWGTIAAGDVPTLNQNTTGTAANVTGTVAVVNGGTGQTTYTNGQLLIGNTTGNTLAKATLTQGTGVTITNGTGAITVAIGQAVAIASTPQFTRLGLGQAADATALLAGTKSAIATTSTNGLILQNTTAATAGVPQQYSPRITLNGTAYNSTAPASQIDNFAIENQPQTVAGTTTTNLVFTSSIAGGAYSTNATLTSGGVFNLASGGSYQINGTSVLTSNTLGSGVTASSLTSVGALTSGSLGSGFTVVGVAQGGNGTSTAPSAGQILVASSSTAYAPKTFADETLSPTNPAAITATSPGDFAGLSSGTTNWAPTATGQSLITMTGNITYSTTTATYATVQMRYGTVSGPTNGTAATTGTAIGSLESLTDNNNSHTLTAPFHCTAFVSLTAGTSYWIDAAIAASTGSVTISNVTITVVELP